MSSFDNENVDITVRLRGRRQFQTDAAATAGDIKQIDRALEKALASLLDERLTSGGSLQDPVPILASAATSIDRELGGGVRGVRWWVTPYHSYEMSPAAQSSPQDSVLVRQRFDFSASHRLHNPAMSEAENRARFGKCNNPAGHGHNYVIEPAVRVALGPGFDRAFTHADLQDLCTSAIISRFDHTHLNMDTAEFSEKTGVLPTVENIARVFFEILAPRIAAHGGASLASMTVWETDRTSSTYPG